MINEPRATASPCSSSRPWTHSKVMQKEWSRLCPTLEGVKLQVVSLPVDFGRDSDAGFPGLTTFIQTLTDIPAPGCRPSPEPRQPPPGPRPGPPDSGPATTSMIPILAKITDALGHAGTIQVGRSLTDDAVVEQQILRGDRLHEPLEPFPAPQRQRRLKDGSGGDDGGNHDQGPALFPGQVLAHVQRIAAADRQHPLRLGKSRQHLIQDRLAHASLQHHL